MGSILARKSKSGTKYRAKILDSHGKEIYRTFDRKTDATRWITEQEQKKNTEGLVRQDKGVLFAEYCEWWLKEREGKIANRSLENWASVIRLYLEPFFKKRPIGKIVYQDGLDLQAELKAKDLSPKTINHILGTLRQILLYATKGQGYRKQIFGNPLAGLEMLPLEEQKLIYWDKDEIRSFLDASKEDFFFDVYLFAINTGSRLGEIAGLTADKVDLKKRIITFSNALKRENNKQVIGTTKSGKTRHFPINNSLHEMLSKRCKGLKPGQFVFTDKNGDPLDLAHFARIFAAAQQAAGIKKIIRFHDLRHTFASNFVMNGGDLFTLQKLLGHSDTKMTMFYAHLSQKHFQNFASVVEF